MGRSTSFKMGLKKGPWTSEEDQKLVAFIEEHGHECWRTLPHKAGLQRCGKSCRLRWKNYLRPDIKRGRFSLQEEQTIMQLHALLGNRWSAIATHLPKRTDNEIKNYWNTHLKKRLTKMGIDPVTHKSIAVHTNLSHMTQWENARLEAENRLGRQSTLVSQHIRNISSPLTNKTLIQPFLQPQPLCLNVLNQSYLQGPQAHISTSSFYENALASFDERNTTVCMNDCGMLREPFNNMDISKEENMFGVDEIMYQDGYVMDALTYPSANNAYNEVHGINDNYWRHILGK